MSNILGEIINYIKEIIKKLKDTIEGGKARRFREDFGKLVAVKDRETYKRAKVLGQVWGQCWVGDNFAVLFLDYGDWVGISSKDIFFVSDNFFTNLPFQGVRCRLAGVRLAQGKNWCENAGDCLWDYIRTKEEDRLVDL